MKDYYAILGVRENAGSAEIKRAYRLLAVRYHPDKNPSHEAEELFKEINEAYDVLSDLNKKFFYDQRRYNPLQDLVTEEPVRTHRDPRYRPKSQAQRRAQQKSAQYLLMEKWNKYARWINIAGIVVVVIYAIDFVLPTIETDETVTTIRTIRGKNGSFAYYRVGTESGKRIKVYNQVGAIGDSFHLESTVFYRIPMRVRTDTTDLKMGFVYGPMAIFPLILLFSSFMGIVYRKNVAQAFNYCIGTAILIIITLFLIY